jgi:uncharacterized protein YggE
VEKKQGRAGGIPPVRPISEPNNTTQTSQEDTKTMPSQALRTEAQMEGVTVIGEAVRRVQPERAEFLIEVTATALTAAQALRDNQAKTMQVGQAIAPLGVQPADIQTISLKVHSLYAPVIQPLAAYAGAPQIGQVGFSPYAPGPPAQPDVQFGSYHATNVLRINVRDPGRVGDIADAAARAGASISGSFCFRAGDEPGARRAALEAAGHDARKKAEVLASAAGKQVGEPITITEDILASNGTYAALRATMPFALGPGAPEVAGELEYYARVSASFRFQ